MQKTKAAFKALREECGLTQADIAAEADVSIRAAKKWEDPNSDIKEPPDDVWQFLLACRGAMYQDAREMADQIIKSLKDVDGAHDLKLAYYRKQEDLDAVQPPETNEPLGYVNARTRLVGQLLDKAEVPYTYEYK